jgi:hypothetical protein
MLSGSPHPLPSECTVSQLLPLLRGYNRVGAWLRSARREFHLRVHGRHQRVSLLVGRDLGSLLRRCNWIAVRVEEQPLLVAAEELIRCRVLQVVIGTPYLPSVEQLRSLFPEVQPDRDGFWVPVQDSAPEEVLGVCLTQGIPVMESRIDYRWPTRVERPRAR